MRVVSPDLQRFNSEVNAWLLKAEELAVNVARGLAVEVFKRAVNGSPIFSGDFMSSWKFEVGSVTPSFTPITPVDTYKHAESGHLHRYLTEVEQTGYSRASLRDLAYAENLGKELGVVKLGPTIYIHNSAEHDQQYAMMVENNTIKWRAENAKMGTPGGKAIHSVAGEFGVISPVDAARLASTFIGA